MNSLLVVYSCKIKHNQMEIKIFCLEISHENGQIEVMENFEKSLKRPWKVMEFKIPKSMNPVLE